MQHPTNIPSLYGTLVPAARHEFGYIKHRHALKLFGALRKILAALARMPFHYPGVQHFAIRVFVAGVLLGMTLSALAANTEATAAATPLAPANDADLMESPEKFNGKFQTTWIVAEHGAFNAPYSGTNSLLPIHEKAYTWTATAFFGFRPFANTELYFNPEMIQSNQFSGLHGLGGFNNNESPKMGATTPTFYLARLFVRQTFNLGGETIKLESGQNQLAGSVDSNRVVVTVGKISTPDIFDNNAYAHDVRTQFLNSTFFTHISSDFAADARGYTWGAALVYYVNDWAFRVGQFTQPINSNGLELEHSLTRYPAQQFEIEHSHNLMGQPGKVRLYAFRNRARMGNFDEAVTFAQVNGKNTPDVADVRRNQTKTGGGLNLEQSVSPEVGVFGRAGFNNGKTETYQFSEVDRSISGGVSLKGALWGREKDTVGLAVAKNDISSAHRSYLAAGGLGAFIGDGRLPNYRSEKIFEIYYNIALKNHISLAADFQRIANPHITRSAAPSTSMRYVCMSNTDA